MNLISFTIILIAFGGSSKKKGSKSSTHKPQKGTEDDERHPKKTKKLPDVFYHAQKEDSHIYLLGVNSEAPLEQARAVPEFVKKYFSDNKIDVELVYTQRASLEDSKELLRDLAKEFPDDASRLKEFRGWIEAGKWKLFEHVVAEFLGKPTSSLLSKEKLKVDIDFANQDDAGKDAWFKRMENTRDMFTGEKEFEEKNYPFDIDSTSRKYKSDEYDYFATRREEMVEELVSDGWKVKLVICRISSLWTENKNFRALLEDKSYEVKTIPMEIAQ